MLLGQFMHYKGPRFIINMLVIMVLLPLLHFILCITQEIHMFLWTTTYNTNITWSHMGLSVFIGSWNVSCVIRPWYPWSQCMRSNFYQHKALMTNKTWFYNPWWWCWMWMWKFQIWWKWNGFCPLVWSLWRNTIFTWNIDTSDHHNLKLTSCKWHVFQSFPFFQLVKKIWNVDLR